MAVSVITVFIGPEISPFASLRLHTRAVNLEVVQPVIGNLQYDFSRGDSDDKMGWHMGKDKTDSGAGFVFSGGRGNANSGPG
jgi:hypothetical protein